MAKPEDIQLDDKANQWDRIVTQTTRRRSPTRRSSPRYVNATNLMDLDSFDGYVRGRLRRGPSRPGDSSRAARASRVRTRSSAAPFSDAVFVFADLFAEGDLRVRPRRDQRHERR